MSLPEIGFSNEEQQNERKEYDRFLYMVSHDLQEPIRLIHSFLKLLRDKNQDVLDSHSLEYIQHSLSNSERMQGMLKALLELSRIERSTDETEYFLFQEIIDFLQNKYSRKTTLDINFDLKSIGLSGNKELIKRLFSVLIDNAIENSEDHPHISIGTTSDVTNLTFSISDQGKGIKEIYLERVQEIFQSAGRTEGKVGSGLTIAKAIMGRHDGKLILESEEGVGTTIHLIFKK